MDLDRDDVLFCLGVKVRVKNIDVNKLIELATRFRAQMKQSKFKIWMRAGLLIQFSIMFSFLLYRDIQQSYFSWSLAVMVVALSIPFGFVMSKLVPMRFDESIKKVTMSIDMVYLVLIWVLVIARVVLGILDRGVTFTDGILCFIIGLMAGRLGGIGLRVRKLKLQQF